MLCEFIQSEPGHVQCQNCARRVATKFRPEQVRAECRRKIRGLGDTIAKITSAVGIKPCVRCRERQQKLNELFPFS